MAAVKCAWKEVILSRLKQRDARENLAFGAVVDAYTHLVETVGGLKAKVEQLNHDKTRLEQEKLELQVRAESTEQQSSPGLSSQKALEDRLSLQAELTRVFKEKDEGNRQITAQRNMLQEKDKELSAKEVTLSELENKIFHLEEGTQVLSANIEERELTDQVLKDEYQALQIAFTSLEGKYRKSQEDNNELVTRWMALKSREADTMNEENVRMRERVQQGVRDQIARATSAEVAVPVLDAPETVFNMPLCAYSSVPSNPQHSFVGHDSEIHAIRWGVMGRLFATGGTDRKIKLWETRGGSCHCKGTLTGSNAAITNIDFDPEDNLVLGASNDFALRVWTVADQRLRHTFTGHSGKVHSAKFLGESNKAVSGSNDRTLKIWDLQARACIKTMFAGSSCNDVACCGGFGSSIISGHFDKKIRFWDTRSESSTNELLLDGRITSLCVSLDGNYLLSCSRDDSLKVIDIRRNTVLATFTDYDFKVASDWTRAAFSPDGQYLAAGSNNGVVFVWDKTKNKLEKALKEHKNPVLAVSWHPNGSSLVSCDKQKKVVIWSDY